jgi:hypothetical protein
MSSADKRLTLDEVERLARESFARVGPLELEQTGWRGAGLSDLVADPVVAVGNLAMDFDPLADLRRKQGGVGSSHLTLDQMLEWWRYRTRNEPRLSVPPRGRVKRVIVGAVMVPHSRRMAEAALTDFLTGTEWNYRSGFANRVADAVTADLALRLFEEGYGAALPLTGGNLNAMIEGALGRVARNENGAGGFWSHKSWAFLVGARPAGEGFGLQFGRHRTIVAQRDGKLRAGPLRTFVIFDDREPPGDKDGLTLIDEARVEWLRELVEGKEKHEDRLCLWAEGCEACIEACPSGAVGISHRAMVKAGQGKATAFPETTCCTYRGGDQGVFGIYSRDACGRCFLACLTRSARQGMLAGGG